ncbi:MAG: hypothetical protein KDA93_03095 [Planctomycetaceae bacterium]|nr:hypothetical protein [Planctomycetaceae bacterium]
MLERLRASLLTALLLTSVSLDSRADDETPTAPPIDELKATAAAAETERDGAAEQKKSTTEKLQQIERELLDLRRELKKAQEALKSAEENLPKHQEAAKAAVAAKDVAVKAKVDADQALAEAQKRVEEAATKATEAEKASTEAANTVTETEKALATAKSGVETTVPKVEMLMASLDTCRTELTTANEQLEQLTASWVSKQQAVEHALKEAGEWVSFAEEVAPVFNQRCVACHNTRTAKGRLNMESYTALMKGGESGEIIDPGDGELSTLCVMVEDGSMPKDADPLTEEQIALVKRWVELGAKLDAGVDATKPLIRIMPKQPQPTPPESYNVTLPVTAVELSPDGSLLATSGYHEVLLWNTSDGSLVRRISNMAERITDLDFHPDGDRLAVAAGTPGSMGEALIVKASDGSVVKELSTVEDAMFGVAFSPDGTKLVACGADRAIRVFDVETGEELTVIEDHADWVMDIAWSPDGTKLASASRDKTSKLFDATTGDAQVTFNKHGEVVFGVTFLPDGKTVATSGRDKMIRLWTVEKGDQSREIGGFGHDVFQVTALPDGRLISCSADKTARLHTSADGKEVRKFEGNGDWVFSVAAHPESQRLLTGCYDGEVRLWNLETGEVVLSFKAAPGLQQVSADATP